MNAIVWLVLTVGELFMITLILQIHLEAQGVSRHDVGMTLISRITRPMLSPLRSWLPSHPRWNVPAIVSLFAWSLVVSLLHRLGPTFHLLAWLGGALGYLIETTLTVFIYAIILQAIASLLAPQHTMHPLQILLRRTTEPLLRPFQRWIPPMNGIDLSPIPAIISLQFIMLLIAKPMLHWGQSPWL